MKLTPPRTPGHRPAPSRGAALLHSGCRITSYNVCYTKLLRQEGRLDLCRGAIDLVGEHQVMKQGTGLELEAPGLWPIYVGSREITGEQVRRKLDPFELQSQTLRERFDRRGLRQASYNFV